MNKFQPKFRKTTGLPEKFGSPCEKAGKDKLFGKRNQGLIQFFKPFSNVFDKSNIKLRKSSAMELVW
jgi:hypothetical protein